MAKSDLMILLCVLFVITVSFTVVSGYGTLVGGRTPINDVKNNKEVQELGRFAVEEYNRRSKGRLYRGNNGAASSELIFSQVEAQKQVVSGIKYYLKIDAKQDGLTKRFESVVVVKPWVKSKELLNFTPSTQ